MSEPVIRVENLGKKYRIRHQSEGRKYKTLRDALTSAPKRLWSKMRPGSRTGEGSSTSEDFWALRDVSFTIQQGEAVGIIGRNGAGKSTLLKLLSRITEPTTGRIELEGRVASLLEVGTGFHPELTGRENIYLNGSVLGMSHTEIRARFDEIVAFAEVDRFLDTPVKRYSSGMYMRLAFSVAAHLEPEILIVDEVLAVGDADFQKKCIGKMQTVSSHEGRTVLFVSHTMAAIRQLCTRCILLGHGKIVADDTPVEVVGKYLDIGTLQTTFTSFNFQATHPKLNLIRAELNKVHLRFGEAVAISFFLECSQEMTAGIECALRDQSQTPIAYYGTGTIEGYEVKLERGLNKIEIHYPHLPLAQGTYSLDFGVSKSGQFFYILAESAVSFSIDEARPLQAGFWFSQGRGSVFLPCTVKTENKSVFF
jgi:lipopolysaccharide transport system ATP-binding protein